MSWIHSNPSRWKSFVCNRVTERQTYTTPTQWEHCRGVDNPADYLSKGVNANQLKGLDAWLRQPAWLSKGVQLWPCDASTIEQSPPEERKTPHAVLHIHIPAPLLDPSRYSFYWRLLSITAWIFRFIRNVRFARRSSGELTASELTQARLHWIKAAQAECFSTELDAHQKNADLPRESKISRFKMDLFVLEGAYNAPTFQKTYVTHSCSTASTTLLTC